MRNRNGVDSVGGRKGQELKKQREKKKDQHQVSKELTFQLVISAVKSTTFGWQHKQNQTSSEQEAGYNL